MQSSNYSPEFSPPSRPIKRSFLTWIRTLWQRLMRRVQAFLNPQSSRNTSSSFPISLPTPLRLSQTRNSPESFLQGLEDLPEFSYFLNQDLVNSIAWDFSDAPNPIFSSTTSTDSTLISLSLDDLSQVFSDTGTFPQQEICAMDPSKSTEEFFGLDTLPNWDSLSVQSLLESLRWEPLAGSIASEEDLSLLEDLLVNLPID